MVEDKVSEEAIQEREDEMTERNGRIFQPYGEPAGPFGPDRFCLECGHSLEREPDDLIYRLSHDPPSLTEVLEKLRAQMPRLREEEGITALYIVGNYAAGIATKDSIIDIVVETDRHLSWGGVGLQHELGKLLGIECQLQGDSVITGKLNEPLSQHAVKV